MTILFDRAVLLATKELIAFRTDEITEQPIANPELTEAILVEEPNFGADATILDRNNVKFHLSPDPGTPGRKIATISFSHEVRHNGNLDGSVEGKLGRLLDACGMAGTAITASSGAGSGTDTILDDAPIPVNSPTGSFTYTKTNGYIGELPRVLELTADASGGGDSGNVTFTVFAPAVGSQAEIDLGAAAMSDATAYALSTAAEGFGGVTPVQITPTITTSFATGDTFIINLAPYGFTYVPVSDTFDSNTFHLYYDGLRHIMTGARGTFTVEGEAGNFAKFNFTFTGDYNDPTDTAMPSGSVFETTIPAQVELSNMVAAGGQADVDYDLCAQSFSIDMGNNVVARECINEEDSLAGAIITGRSPTAAFNPETELEATHPFWANLNTAARVSFSVRVGSEQGNCVTFWAPYAQYASLAYTNRNDIRAYDVNMRLNSGDSSVGDDELRITFS